MDMAWTAGAVTFAECPKAGVGSGAAFATGAIVELVIKSAMLGVDNPFAVMSERVGEPAWCGFSVCGKPVP